MPRPRSSCSCGTKRSAAALFALCSRRTWRASNMQSVPALQIGERFDWPSPESSDLSKMEERRGAAIASSARSSTCNSRRSS
eukprot:scaffold279011_cov28-Tisochrysis_lutea.AAC.1